MPPILTATGIHRSFRIGKRHLDILRGISLDVERGEVVALRGASGAGKTTLLYTLAGLERPQQGKVLFDGHDVFALSDKRLTRLRNEKMGFVFQGYFLLPELTALENVLVPSMIRGTRDKARALELLARVGLADRANHLPSELSGGEQQRVGIARALANDPSIIFADEPTGNLDSRTGAEVVATLLDIVRSDQRTLLIVTHDDHLAHQCDRILHIVDGHLGD